MVAKVCATFPYPKPLKNADIGDAWNSNIAQNEMSWSPWSGQTTWSMDNLQEGFNDAVEINDLLRSGSALTDEAEESMMVFDTMLDETLEVPESFTMYAPIQGIQPALLEPGTILHDKGYRVGFSQSVDVLPGFTETKIIVPDGTQLGKFVDTEGEISLALKRDSRFRVLGVDNEGKLNLELLPEDLDAVEHKNIFLKDPTKAMSGTAGDMYIVGVPAAAQKKAAKAAGLNPSDFSKPELPTLPGGSAAPAINVVEAAPTKGVTRVRRSRTTKTATPIGEFGVPTKAGLPQIRELWREAGTAGQTKENIERTLSRFLVNTEEDKEFWFKALRLKDKAPYDPVRGTYRKKAVSEWTISDVQNEVYDHVRSWIDTWAMTSADEHIHALLMQKAAAIEFLDADAVDAMDALIREKLATIDRFDPVTGKYLTKTGSVQEALDGSTFAKQRGLVGLTEQDYMDQYQRFLRAMYDHTQQTFKRYGITHVTMYRGMAVNGPRFPGASNVSEYIDLVRESGGVLEGPISLRPMSSFAFTPSVAEGFVNGSWTMNGHVYAGFVPAWEKVKIPVLVSADVPVENIIGSALTGFGCLNEKECVVLPGRGVVRMTVVAPRTR